MKEIIGKKVLTIRAFNESGKFLKKKSQCFLPQYILFDDKITIMIFEEQDYNDFHDCDSGARNISIRQDEQLWKQIFENKRNYPEANTDFYY